MGAAWVVRSKHEGLHDMTQFHVLLKLSSCLTWMKSVVRFTYIDAMQTALRRGLKLSRKHWADLWEWSGADGASRNGTVVLKGA